MRLAAVIPVELSLQGILVGRPKSSEANLWTNSASRVALLMPLNSASGLDVAGSPGCVCVAADTMAPPTCAMWESVLRRVSGQPV